MDFSYFSQFRDSALTVRQAKQEEHVLLQFNSDNFEVKASVFKFKIEWISIRFYRVREHRGQPTRIRSTAQSWLQATKVPP